MREWLREDYGDFWIGAWLVEAIEACAGGLLILPWCVLLAVFVGLPSVVVWVLCGLVATGMVGWAFVALVREDCAMRAIVRAGRRR